MYRCHEQHSLIGILREAAEYDEIGSVWSYAGYSITPPFSTSSSRKGYLHDNYKGYAKSDYQ